MMKECYCCHQQFEGESEFCSKACEDTRSELNSWIVDSCFASKTQDSRVFFYDIGFGRLCSMYTVYVLRWTHEKSMKERREIDFHLDRIASSIQTKLNRIFIDDKLAKGISDLFMRLFDANSRGWVYRKKLWHDREAQEISYLSKMFFKEVLTRDEIVNQLDKLIEGRIRPKKVY